MESRGRGEYWKPCREFNGGHSKFAVLINIRIMVSLGGGWNYGLAVLSAGRQARSAELEVTAEVIVC